MNVKIIKNYLNTKVGSNIIVMYCGSRNKKEIYRGVLYKIYKNIFVIKLFNNNLKSFSYTDILTKTIQICI